ncbi:hypothetical protein CI610_03543 [invertebrate metagenome]|uniref:Uncharacterized protein n=1 Tax=invertebrate metagenome TaxID=1711999 RepID=A0A2H9T2T2_9ZZZZ
MLQSCLFLSVFVCVRSMCDGVSGYASVCACVCFVLCDGASMCVSVGVEVCVCVCLCNGASVCVYLSVLSV